MNELCRYQLVKKIWRQGEQEREIESMARVIWNKVRHNLRYKNKSMIELHSSRRILTIISDYLQWTQTISQPLNATYIICINPIYSDSTSYMFQNSGLQRNSLNKPMANKKRSCQPINIKFVHIIGQISIIRGY